MPLAGAFDSRSEEPPDRVPLRLMWCSECKLLQTGESVDRDQVFLRYSYQSHAAPSLVRHFEDLADDIVEILGPGKNGLVIDVGCNDGVLVNPLQEREVAAVGIDPSDVALAASQRDGWPLVNSYLSESLSQQVRSEYGPAAIVVASNVFAHNDNIHELAQSVRNLLADDGVFICEVQYAGSLLDGRQFDTIYHEHAVYYSVESLYRLLRDHGLYIRNIMRIPTHSGSIRIFATPQPREDVRWTDPMPLDVESFSAAAHRSKKIIQETLFSLAHSGKTVWAYGAAGRCTVLLNWCNMSEVVAAVVDNSPRRIGRVVPVVNIPIVSPAFFDVVAPDVTVVTAWNYFDSIREQHPNYRGLWIRPLPELTIL